MITHTSPRELHAWLQGAGQRPAPLLLDVREPWEHGICRIAGSRLVPMQQIPSQLDTLPRESAIVVICHHGMRSLQVAAFLVEAAFTSVHNLSGGIAAWAEQVEPAMARY